MLLAAVLSSRTVLLRVDASSSRVHGNDTPYPLLPPRRELSGKVKSGGKSPPARGSDSRARGFRAGGLALRGVAAAVRRAALGAPLLVILIRIAKKQPTNVLIISLCVVF